MQIDPRMDLHQVQGPRPVPNFGDAETRKRLTPAAVSAILQIAERWTLRSDDARLIVGDISERTWFRVKSRQWSGVMTQDQLTRVSALLGIFKGLRLLFVGSLADEWINLPNGGPLFGGATPLQLMLEGGIPAILDVRQHVDGLRGGL